MLIQYYKVVAFRVLCWMNIIIKNINIFWWKLKVEAVVNRKYEKKIVNIFGCSSNQLFVLCIQNMGAFLFRENLKKNIFKMLHECSTGFMPRQPHNDQSSLMHLGIYHTRTYITWDSINQRNGVLWFKYRSVNIGRSPCSAESNKTSTMFNRKLHNDHSDILSEKLKPNF